MPRFHQPHEGSERQKLRKLRTYEADVRAQVEEIVASLSADRKEAMLMIDGMDADSTLKGLVKARYLGKPVEVIAKHKGKSVQYVRESEIDRYYLVSPTGDNKETE